MERLIKTPTLRLALVLILASFGSVACLLFSLTQPFLDHALVPNAQVSSPAGTLTTEELDLISEPSGLNRRADFDRFLIRQNQIAEIISASPLTISTSKAVTVVSARPRTIGDLPVRYWVPLFVGFFAFILSGWIWSLRPRDLPVKLFFLSGIALFIGAGSSAIYTCRVWALPIATFKLLQLFNSGSSIFFGIPMIGLFLVYPTRLPNWRRWFIAAALSVASLWTVAFFLPFLVDGPLVALEMLSICVAIGFQYYFTKRRPTERAVLHWLGLSVAIGGGAFVVANIVPIMIGAEPLDQGYAFAFFLFIYLGLLAGLLRFRLFDVGLWAFRFLFYGLGALALVCVDALLIYVVGVDRLPAWGISVLVLSLVYLPLRDAIWTRISKRKLLGPQELLQEVLKVVMAPSEKDRARRWIQLLTQTFEPLIAEAVESENRNSNKAKLSDDGLHLYLPSVARYPALKISYPSRGRTIFSSASLALVDQLLLLVSQAESTRDAYDRGVSEERRRVAQDLHDDLSARLLSGLHAADETMKPTFLGAISDIRTIVGDLSGEKKELHELVLEIRFEAERRLRSAGMECDWPIAGQNLGREQLDYRHSKALVSSVREIVSNVVRHSGASKLTVRSTRTDSVLYLSLIDDGKGLQTQFKEGFGLRSIQKRILECGGEFRLVTDLGGTQALVQFPLELAADKASNGKNL